MNIDTTAHYNDEGILLVDDIKIVRPEFCVPDEDKADWSLVSFGDADGFDTRYIGNNGTYIETIILPPGKKLMRYGYPAGSFTADVGTDYNLLSLPYVQETMPYHEYIVRKNCEVDCIVVKGMVAPGFDSLGGAIQYKHQLTIIDSVEHGILEEDYSWIRSKINK